MPVSSEMSSVWSKPDSFLVSEVVEAECLLNKFLAVPSISTIIAAVRRFPSDTTADNTVITAYLN